MKDNSKELLKLRQKAEDIWKRNHEQNNFTDKEVELSKLYYELEVHQIELQMQNDELLQSILDTRNMADKYFQLYDFAPTGFFTLSKDGQILEVNLSGAKMLGRDRSEIIDSNFIYYLSEDSKAVYKYFVDELFRKQVKQECEVSILKIEGSQIYLHLIGLTDNTNTISYLSVVDITERRELMNLNKTLLESLPYPAMYIRYNGNVILDSNDLALKLGFEIGKVCWSCFEVRDTFSIHENDKSDQFSGFTPKDLEQKCSCCRAEQCMFEGREQTFSQFHAFGSIWDVHWVKVSSEVYLHYFVDITERIRYEESLRESELFLKQTQQIARLGSYSLDVITGEWICSEIMDAVLGISVDYIKNVESWVALIHPDWQVEMLTYFQNEVLTKKNKFDKEYKIVRPTDSQVRWVHGMGELVLNEMQQPVKMIGTIQDITNSKDLELERKYLLASVENVPNRIVVKDLDLKVVSANRSWINSKGEVSIDNLIGKTDAELFGVTSETEPIRTYMEQDRKVLSLSPGEFIESELPVKLFNGEDTIASLRRYPIFDDKGNLFCIGCIATDITERKKIEAVLASNQRQLSNIIDFLPDPTMVVDQQGCVTIWNQGMEEITGASSKEMFGKLPESYAPLFHSDLRPLLLNAFFRDEDEIIDRYSNLKRKGDTIMAEIFHDALYDHRGAWIYSKASPLRDQSGSVVGAIESLRDISERKENEQEIANLNETLERKVIQRTVQLEDANKELEAFTYSVSHDLRAPLRHISGFSEMLAKDTQEQLSDKGRHYLEVINDAAHKMGHLIDDLLDFSRTSRVELDKKKFKMNTVVEEACQLLTSVTESRNITWEIAELPVVIADYNLIRLVWVNLLDNALKYTRKKESVLIQINCEKVNHEVVFSVKDNGVGFDMNYIEKLFGVFQRLHSSSEFEGTGIGLANVRRIILRHGGRTWAESELDRWAKFYFTLPQLEL